jgi:hypothetical protein
MRRLERVVQHLLAARGARPRELTGDERLAASRRAAYDDQRMTKPAAAGHLVESGDAARHPRVHRIGRLAVLAIAGCVRRVDRKHRQAARPDRTRVFTFDMRAAPVLADLDRPPPAAAVDDVPQHDGHITHEALDADGTEVAAVVL